MGFSMRNIAKQAVAHHTFMAFGSWDEMAKLLPVAHEWLRKHNFRKVIDMITDVLSMYSYK